MKQEIIKNMSNVSQDILTFLIKAKDGHYYIERMQNRENKTPDRFKISNEFANELINMANDEAWKKIERYLGVM